MSKLLSRATRPASILAACAGLFAIVAAEAQEAPASQNNVYINYKNQRFGYELSYPSPIFTPGEEAENGEGLTFISTDGRAKIVTFASFNNEKFTPQTYRRALIEEYGGYDLLSYQPMGAGWFVLSGYREENIYYEKIMFSCGNQIINVLAISFPKDEKPFYANIVERVEDYFKTGRGADTPADCG